MSTGPVVQPGQLSPDGLWRWDGTQWVPVAPSVSTMPAARRSKAWVWVAGGCVLLLILGVIGIGFGAYSLVKGFQNGAFNCLPSDFPGYPGATVMSENTKIGSGFAPGDSKRCTIVLESNDDVATVTSFYTLQLDTGDWTVASSDPSSGEIQFTRKSRSATVGDLLLLGRGQHTEIQIQLDS
jgi:hypothetical protein